MCSPTTLTFSKLTRHTPRLASKCFRGSNISVATPTRTDVIIRPLAENEIPEAARIIRLAFSTFLGLSPEDSRWPAGVEHAGPRWKVDPSSVLAAECDGKLIGSNFAAHWGSFGFFGPLTVDPAFWNQNVAQQLLAPTMEIFQRWDTRHLGLFTFAQSPKHMVLYQKFGFWPRDLVAVMAKEVGVTPRPASPDSTLYSEAKPDDRPQLLVACREVTDALFEGLDLEREIRAVSDQNFGNTILVWEGAKLVAFAVCHAGTGTEAGTGVCYVKFAAVRPGPNASRDIGRLIDALEVFAGKVGAHKITAGVNLARREAFQLMIARGFRIEIQGVAMESGGPSTGYNRAGVYILDDWR